MPQEAGGAARAPSQHQEAAMLRSADGPAHWVPVAAECALQACRNEMEVGVA